MTDKLSVRLETFTPAKAEKVLDEQNIGNRQLRKTVVEKYARDMEHDNWRLTTDTIKFNGDGSLIDGQHRLAAAVAANKSLETYVARGVDSDAREAMDTGLRRTFSDVLTWKGETQTVQLAAAIRTGFRWQSGHIFGPSFGSFSHAEGLEWYSLNPSIRSTIGLAVRLRNRLRVPPPATAAFLHRIALIDPEQADSFIAAIDMGEGLMRGDPLFALRSWLQNQMAKTPAARFNADYYLAVMLKAWAYWVQGERMNLMSFKRGGTFKEDLPALIDFEGNVIKLKNELTKPVPIPVPDQYR